MQFSQKILKSFSFDLLHDFEEGLINVLNQGVQRDWTKWLPQINKGILAKAESTALKNKRSVNFNLFSEFIKNIDFADPIEIIVNLSSSGNQYFSNFFSNPKEKNILQQNIGEVNRFRNLIFHPGGKTVYLVDIKAFLRASKVIFSILKLSSLKIRFENLGDDIEQSIISSNHFIKESFDEVYHNLPNPDYEEWFGLIGRDTIKEKIIQDFNSGYNRVLAITGGGGIGKSALALDISREFIKPNDHSFRHVIWITSKNNFLDYSGITQLRPDYFYNNNYKDFLNQFLSGFYNKLYETNLDLVSEEQLEKDIVEIFENYSRILCVVDNLENIDDPKILEFIKNKILPPNYVLITSRKGLGEINKTYRLEPLDDVSAFKLFENLCSYYNIDIKNINTRKLKELLKMTNNYPLVIKWCLSLVANKKMEIESAFSQLNKPHSDLLEFIFQKLYSQISKNSKRVLRALALYKDIPDRNIISYIADLETEDDLTDAIFELEQHSLIIQERIDSKNGIIETISLLGLAQTFLNNIVNIDKITKTKFENRILEIEEELDFISDDLNKDFRPAQKLAQSKLLKALRLVSDAVFNKAKALLLVSEAERLAPGFYLIPFYKALIEMRRFDYEYSTVKQLLEQSISINPSDPFVQYEYGKILRKHKKESHKQYARVFHAAFRLDNKIGYGIDAASAYFLSSNYSIAYEIIGELRGIGADFPRDHGQKYLVSQVVLGYTEALLHHNIQLSVDVLMEIENYVNELASEKTKAYRMLKGKFYSLLGLLLSIQGEKIKAMRHIESSNRIIQTYRSVDRNSLEIKEVICYNLVSELVHIKEGYIKKSVIRKIENECVGKDKKVLLNKFQKLTRRISLGVKV